jgi:FkbM family methyltransferase
MDLADILVGSIWGRILRSPLHLLPKDASVPILMGPLCGMRWISGSQRHACWLGIYEPDLQKLLWQRLRPGRVFYDVGANAGFYTLLAAKCMSGGTVIAFEPVPENVAYLRRHIHLNRLQNVRLIEAAVSDCDDMIGFRCGRTRSEGQLSPNGELKVQSVTLDSLISREILPSPHFIKMDIEGGEYKALLGARTCFERLRPELFLATHGKTTHEDCCRLLSSWGYKQRVITNREEGRAEIHAVPSIS